MQGEVEQVAPADAAGAKQAQRGPALEQDQVLGRELAGERRHVGGLAHTRHRLAARAERSIAELPHATTRIISASVVLPRSTLASVSSCRLRMPCSRATAAMASVGARSAIMRRTGSVACKYSKTARRPL